MGGMKKGNGRVVTQSGEGKGRVWDGKTQESNLVRPYSLLPINSFMAPIIKGAPKAVNVKVGKGKDDEEGGGGKGLMSRMNVEEEG